MLINIMRAHHMNDYFPIERAREKRNKKLFRFVSRIHTNGRCNTRTNLFIAMT